MFYFHYRRKGAANGDTLGRPCRSGSCVTESLEARLLLSGTVYTVDSLADVVAEDGYVTLREALEAARTDTAVNEAPAGSADETDIVRFAEALFSDGPQTIEIDGAGFELFDVNLTGPGGDLLTLRGNGIDNALAITGSSQVSDLAVAGAYTAVHIASGSGPTHLADLHLHDNAFGVASGRTQVDIDRCLISNNTGDSSDPGAGITMLGSQLTVSNSIISGNSTSTYGAGIYQQNWPYSAIEIRDTLIANNSAGVDGGGLYLRSAFTMIDCELSGNSAGNDGGGILWNPNMDGVSEIIDSVIAGNRAREGGGIYSMGRLLVTGGEITGNTASGNGGGVMANTEETTFDSVLIAYNGAEDNGGAYAISSIDSDISEYTFIDCDIRANYAGSGGVAACRVNEYEDYSFSVKAIGTRFYANYAARGGVFYSINFTAVNSAFIGNEALFYGGVGYGRFGFQGYNCTIVCNSAGYAGGAFLDVHLNVYSSILAMNTVAGQLNDTSPLYDITAYGCLFGALDINTIIGEGNIGGTAAEPMDPMFTADPDPGASGWAYQPGTPWLDQTLDNFYGDLEPAPGSPAIATGLPSGDEVILEAADLVGNPRWLGAGPDIGAVEYTGQSERPQLELLIDGHPVDSAVYLPPTISPGEEISLTLTVQNIGDLTLYLTLEPPDSGTVQMHTIAPSLAWLHDYYYTVDSDGRIDEVQCLFTNDFDHPEICLSVKTAPMGDASLDGAVDIQDFVALKQGYGQTVTPEEGWMLGDFNSDGVVDIADFVLLKQNYGAQASGAAQAARSDQPQDDGAPVADGDVPAGPTLNLVVDLAWTAPALLGSDAGVFDALAAAAVFVD